METKITSTDLARNLSDVLNRVRYREERFLVERNGEPVAALEPVKALPGLTVGELFALFRRMGVPEEGFADELEAIQARQPRVELREWPS